MLSKNARLFLIPALTLVIWGCGNAVDFFLNYRSAQSSSSSISYPSLWSESGANPLFGGVVDGVDRAYYPAVLKIGSIYHIWYGNGQMTLHAFSIYADFHDITHPASQVIVEGVGMTNFYSNYVYHPFVAYQSPGWNINGTNYSQPFVMYATPGFSRVAVLVSSNGSNWTHLGYCSGIVNSPNQGVNVYNFSILCRDGTNWMGYADNGGGQIQYYTSTNGFNWTNQATNILGRHYDPWESATWGCIAPKVVYSDGLYCLYYSSGTNGNDKAIGLAISTNAMDYSKATNNPIFAFTDGTNWRNTRTYTPMIIRDSAIWRMYFTGRSAAGVYSIGTASNLGPLY